MPHRRRLFSKSPSQKSATDWQQIIAETYEIVTVSDASDEVYSTNVFYKIWVRNIMGPYRGFWRKMPVWTCMNLLHLQSFQTGSHRNCCCRGVPGLNGWGKHMQNRSPYGIPHWDLFFLCFTKHCFFLFHFQRQRVTIYAIAGYTKTH